MLELFLSAKSQEPAPFFSINFQDSIVGSQELPLLSQIPTRLQRITRNSDNTDGVVNHPTYGKCYRFTGNVIFQETNASGFLNLLPRPGFKLTIRFVTETAASVPFYTGRELAGKYGIQLYTWTSSPKWAWVTAGSAGRQMNLDSGSGTTPLNSVIEIVLEKKNDTYYLTANGVTFSSYQGPGFSSNDSTLCIGASTNTAFEYALKGYLLSLDITV